MTAEFLRRFDLSGRLAVVTGASGGLGRHFARTLAEAGADVALWARRRDRLDAAAEEVRRLGRRATVVVADVTDGASVATAMAETKRVLGPPGIVVNNSGVAADAAALDLGEDDWDRVLDTNLRGAWLVAKSAAQAMIESDSGGSIVNVASILGFRVAGRVLPYAVSKAGLVQMTKALALEWARHRIRVNAIAPGYVETDINRRFFSSSKGEALIGRIPLRRLARPDELDGALLLLASDASSYMTGSVVVVDGGHLQSSL
jgi:NAD(P)-dependent dehydrogenase (short-subunit alcohol dehydrogenase family)